MARAYGHSSANTTGRRTRSVRGGTFGGKGSGARRLIVSTAASPTPRPENTSLAAPGPSGPTASDDRSVPPTPPTALASPASAAGDACWGADASAGADVAERAGSAGDSAPVSLEATGSAAGGGSALPGGVEGTGPERAATVGRSARAPPRRACPAAGENAGPAALECPRSVRSMNSVPTSVSPLTASSTASTRPADRKSVV